MKLTLNIAVQTLECFDNKEFTLRVVVDLIKHVDKADHPQLSIKHSRHAVIDEKLFQSEIFAIIANFKACVSV